MQVPSKLIDFYPTPRTYGIFFELSKQEDFKNLFALVGVDSNEDFHSLDVDYVYNHAGLKTVSSMMEMLWTGTYVVDSSGNYVINKLTGTRVTFGDAISETSKLLIDMIIRHKFYAKWKGLIDTLLLEFDTLNPYKMDTEEDKTDGLTSENSEDNNRNTSLSDSGSNVGTRNKNGTSGDDKSIFAFDSTTDVPTDKLSSKSDETETNSENYSSSQTGTNSYKGTILYKRDNTIKRTVSRRGNIGNHTSQELVNEQREMLMFQLYDVVYSDLDSVLTRSKYY